MSLYTSPAGATLQDLSDSTSSTALENNASAWPWFRWQQYATMNHYCGTWDWDDNSAADPLSGYHSGKYITCENDPMTTLERKNFCETTKPWWVLTGNVLVTLSLNDLCPFLNNSDVLPYCVVFADHPQ